MSGYRHLSPDLLRRLDDALDDAIGRVWDGEATRATVALAFAVGRDKEGDLVVTFSRKAGRDEQGSFQPTLAGQGRFELDDAA